MPTADPPMEVAPQSKFLPFAVWQVRGKTRNSSESLQIRLLLLPLSPPKPLAWRAPRVPRGSKTPAQRGSGALSIGVRPDMIMCIVTYCQSSSIYPADGHPFPTLRGIRKCHFNWKISSALAKPKSRCIFRRTDRRRSRRVDSRSTEKSRHFVRELRRRHFPAVPALADRNLARQFSSETGLAESAAPIGWKDRPARLQKQSAFPDSTLELTSENLGFGKSIATICRERQRFFARHFVQQGKVVGKISPQRKKPPEKPTLLHFPWRTILWFQFLPAANCPRKKLSPPLLTTAWHNRPSLKEFTFTSLIQIQQTPTP